METETNCTEPVKESSIISTDAISMERIRQRTKIVDNEETRKLLLDDTYKGIQKALDTDGHTGFLSEKDGITRGEVTWYRGFCLQCFAYTQYNSEVDVFGHKVWYGFARMEKKIADKIMKFEFNSFDKSTEHEAGRELYSLVDAFYGDRVD